LYANHFFTNQAPSIYSADLHSKKAASTGAEKYEHNPAQPGLSDEPGGHRKVDFA
jgi:hypothetical protein